MVRIALIGCGGIQRKHARRFHARPDAEIVALADVGLTQCQAFCDNLAKEDIALDVPHHDDLAKLYRETKPDAVSIGTPHTLHFDHAMQALDAGCHVLMEKPMVTSVEQARTLAKRIEEAGKVFLVGFNTPCSDVFQYLRKLVASAELGKLETASGYVAQHWMTGTTGSWRQKPELSGGGFAYDTGAHPMSSLCYVVQSHIAEVFAFIDNHGTPVDINGAIAIRFENGVLATMTTAGNCPPNTGHMCLMFENGRVEVDPWSAKWIRVWKGTKKIDPPIGEGFIEPADNFLDAIAGTDTVRSGPELGVIHSELMEAIYTSAKTGRPAKPPK